MKTLASCLLFALTAAAEEPVPDDGNLEALLEETVVTGASKTAEVSGAAPATVTVITAESLSRFGIHSLDEALNFLSLGMVTQNPLHSVDIGARGVLLTADFGNHVLLLLDGQTLNEQWDGTAYFERGAAIPWEMIDHIEVIVGPGSVLYGSNAMFGVINVVTKRARDYGKVFATVDASGSAPVDANGDVSFRSIRNGGGGIRLAAGGATEFKLLGYDGELTGQIEYYTGEGPRFTFAPQNVGDDAVTGQPKSFGPNTPPGVWGGLARHSYATQVPAGLLRVMWGEVTAEVRAATYTRSTPYLNQFNQFGGDFDNPNNGERDRFVNADVRFSHQLVSWLQLSARLYGGLYDFRQQLETSAAEECGENQSSCVRVAQGASKWLGLELQGRADWATDGRWVTLLGVDGRLRQVGGSYDSTALDASSTVSYAPYVRDEAVMGVYLQQELRPLKWLSLNVSGRLDADSRFGARLSPRAAVAVTLPWSATLKAIYAEAFRAPTAYELYYTDGTAQLAATGLQPETVRSGELTYEQRFGVHRVLAGVFVSAFDHMVNLDNATDEEVAAAIAAGTLRDGATDVVRYRNGSRITNVGGNVSLEGGLFGARLRYGVNLTVAHTERISADGTSMPLTVAPQVFGNARLSFDLGQGRPTFALIAFFAAERPADRAFDEGWAATPMAPAQLDLRATVSGPLPGLPWLSYRFSVTYAFGARSPYVAGPVQEATEQYTMPQLAPVDRLQAGLQLSVRLP